jgi:hypothetical protein
VNDGARQLAAIDMDDLNNGMLEMDDVRDQAPDFTAMFTSLLNVMAIQETKERAKFAKQQASQARSAQIMSSTSSTTATKRAADSQDSTSSANKRLKTDDAPSPPFDARTPPNQLTIAENPHLTNTTDKSGRSIEYKDEESTRKLLCNTIMSTTSLLRRDFRVINWQRGGARVELFQTFYLNLDPANL